MRRLPSLAMLFALLLTSVLVPAAPSIAATFRNEVARVPETPNSAQSVRIWMQSDTALGETAGLEYNVGSSYIKVLGTFDTSGPTPANWRADIPAQPNGTLVRYQLFTRNQSGQDYGFTGFNGSYTVQDDVQWNQVLHDSFDPTYRSIVGPTTPNKLVTLRLRVAQNDTHNARIRVWNDRADTETYYPMSRDSANDASTTYDWWTANVPTGAQPTVLYYFFEINDGTDQDFYVDDDVKFYGGGYGSMSDSYDNSRSFQITVADPNFFTPEWMQRGIIYQIFPDRFRDGDSSNNPKAGRFSYGSNVAITRSNDPEQDWNSTVCDPRSKQGSSFDCADRYGDNFYGGDLKGVTQKIQDGYFSSLGVTILYLNPIFRAPSNHKYDTANFMEIDPDFGTLADFQAMVAAANARGIRIMLDGVFNHTSSDSPYFDRYGRYAANGTINDADGGTDDNSGACEAVSAQYRSWFYFEGDPNTTISNPGKDGSTVVRCADASGNFTKSYEAWYGYSSLPKIRSNLPTVRDYFYGSSDAVGPYWTGKGASGWRFDVGADVDPGVTNENPASPNNYWEGFRSAVRSQELSGKTDTVMLGEEWGDASPWLLGNEWDSAMNYRFRSAALGWMFTGCSGNGCTNGSKFQENDSNDSSSSGSISYVSPSQFNARLRSIHEDYPANAFKSMMNLSGSHDTQRIRFLLKKTNNNSDTAAIQRMKEWWLFAFTYGGAPTLYYGDEVGLSHDGVWDDSQYQDDPYNRAPFPWNDATGSAYVADTTNLQAFARHMASIRHSYRSLQDGDVQHGLVIDDAKQLYGFARTNTNQTALILLNRSNSIQSAVINGLNAAPYNLPNGTVLVDAISDATYTVTNGSVSLNVNSNWGVVLLEQQEIEAPQAAVVTATASGSDVVLSWPQVTKDTTGQPEVITSYQIYRNGTLRATVSNPAFGGNPSYTDVDAAMGSYSYVVRTSNAGGKYSESSPTTPAKQATSLSVSSVTGTYGGIVTLEAVLSSGSAKLAGRTVSFSLNGVSAGTATTNAQGTASLTANLGAIGAGSYTSGVGASFAGDNAYNATSDTANLSVAKATASITLGNLNQVYNGTPQTATATTNPAGLSVAFSYSQNGKQVTSPTDAGSYLVTATINDANYIGSASGTLIIDRATATLAFGALSFTYDGTPKTATVTTSPANLDTLTITYDGSTNAPTNAGTYAVEAKLTNPNYTATPATGKLTINKASATISLTNLQQAYDGNPRMVTATTSPAGLASVVVTYNGTPTPPSSVGTYNIVATLTNPNYSASEVNDVLTIVKADQTITFATPSDKTFGDDPFTVSASSSSKLPVSFTTSGKCTISSNLVTITGAGSCTITASQDGNSSYGAAPDVQRTFSIAKATATLTLSGLQQTYTGTAKPVSVATAPSNLSGIIVTYDEMNTVPVDAGTYTVVAKLDNPNYAAAGVQGTLIINEATATIALSEMEHTYDGTAKSAKVTTNPAGLAVVTTTYGGSETQPINAGSYSVFATLSNRNYKADTASGTLVIKKATATISLGSLTQAYDGMAKAATVTTSPANLDTVTITYDGSTTAPINAGIYAVEAKLTNPNYTATPATGTLTVNKATATLTVNNASYVYDENAKYVTVTTSPRNLSGVTVVYTLNGKAVTSPTLVGNYAVKATLTNPNYTALDATGTLVITSKYTFGGFLQPVDNLPTLNKVKSGSAVPVKFSLGGDYGLGIFGTNTPGSQSVTCGPAAADQIEETTTAGNSSLSYDSVTKQYTYVWKTEKTWSECRQLVIRFSDGSEARANFQFTK